VVSIFEKFAAEGLARGIGKHLIVGTGTNQPKGLITSLQNIGATMITASGSSANDGTAATGANSLGFNDYANAFESLDPAYLASQKVRWLMNLATFVAAVKLVDKQGRPLHLVQYENGSPTIFGIKIGICPSMANIGASNVPVVLGDCSYWCTRLIAAADGNSPAGVKVFKEGPALIDNGEIGLRSFLRADGALLYTDTSSPSPFVLLANHS
jgi:HK97 family phage major capsid protein